MNIHMQISQPYSMLECIEDQTESNSVGDEKGC